MLKRTRFIDLLPTLMTLAYNVGKDVIKFAARKLSSLTKAKIVMWTVPISFYVGTLMSIEYTVGAMPVYNQFVGLIVVGMFFIGAPIVAAFGVKVGRRAARRLVKARWPAVYLQVAKTGF